MAGRPHVGPSVAVDVHSNFRRRRGLQAKRDRLIRPLERFGNALCSVARRMIYANYEVSGVDDLRLRTIGYEPTNQETYDEQGEKEPGSCGTDFQKITPSSLTSATQLARR